MASSSGDARSLMSRHPNAYLLHERAQQVHDEYDTAYCEHFDEEDELYALACGKRLHATTSYDYVA